MFGTKYWNVSSHRSWHINCPCVKVHYDGAFILGDLSGDLGPDLTGLDVCVHVSPRECHQREFGYISMRAPRISTKSVKVMVLSINDFHNGADIDNG